MNLSQFELLCEVARVKSFSKAAKLHHLSQPAVSSQIQSIEDFYGTKLFERSTSGVTLTSSGQLVYQFAKRILKQHDELEKDIDHLLNESNQKLVIGASSAIGNYAIPCSIWTFKEKYPNTQVKLEIRNTENILSLLEENTIHLAMLEDPLPEQYYKHKFVEKTVLNDELVVIAPPKPPWINMSFITLEELKTAPLIIREEGSGVRCMFENVISAYNLKLSNFNIETEMGSIEAIKSTVEAGLGLSVCSNLAIRKEVRSGSIHPLKIKDIELKVDYLLLYKDEKQLNPSAKRFVRFIAGPGNDPFC